MPSSRTSVVNGLCCQIYYQPSLRDRGRRQRKTPECREQRLQARRESASQRRRQETSDQQQQRLQASRDSDSQVMR